MAYVDLTTLKTSLGITDTERDTLLQQALDAASGSIDDKCGRTFERSGVASARVFRVRGRTVRQDYCDLLLVDDIATDTDLVVETGVDPDWTTLADYETEPDNALDRGRPITGLTRVFWSTSGRVRVTAEWGWPEVPAVIVQATLIQASRFYRRKDSPEGVSGSAEWGLVRVPNLDPDVRALITPFILPGFGGG